MESIIGKDRCSDLNTLQSLLNNDISIAAGSDAPCITPNPIDWIDKTVNYPNFKEALSIQEAIRMVTYNGYCATFDENKRGILEVGKIADMVILSKNPYEVDKNNIKDIKG